MSINRIESAREREDAQLEKLVRGFENVPFDRLREVLSRSTAVVEERLTAANRHAIRIRFVDRPSEKSLVIGSNILPRMGEMIQLGHGHFDVYEVAGITHVVEEFAIQITDVWLAPLPKAGDSASG